MTIKKKKKKCDYLTYETSFQQVDMNPTWPEEVRPE
jgi:hypothetical protein